ncbi:MAG: hypothetical protein K9N07_11175 [Candidatus Cloacimonetes bacterium]|nr:hypothetical protein [Candidatus Cloacimonadota bacterium]
MKANYSNLKSALNDNPQSMEYLRQYKNLNTMQWVSVVSGIGLIIAGLSQLDNEEGLSSSGKSLMVLGGITASLAWIPNFAKPEKIESAIEEYNK